jgi:hypothetical protein
VARGVNDPPPEDPSRARIGSGRAAPGATSNVPEMSLIVLPHEN